MGEDRLWDSDTTRGFFQFGFEYGDPFLAPVKKPFEYFDFGIQVNFSDFTALGRVQSRGALFGADLFEGKNSRHIVSSFLHFDYHNNFSYEYGGQSLGAAFLSRIDHGRTQLRTELHLNAILMGADRSDYESITGRQYDYGPGFGFKLRAALARKGRDFFTVAHENHWINVLNGNSGEHFVTFTTARLDIPVRNELAVGTEYVLYTSDRRYDDFEDVSQRNPQIRLYLSWLMSGE
jgi:hypothetical protein